MKKSVFLLLTLAIPVAIFLFLKIFGSNTFDIPILYETGIPGCADSSSPHRVPDFEYIGETEKNISKERVKDFVVFGVLEGGNSNDRKIIELVRIQDAFYEIEAPFFVLFLQGDPESKTALEQQFMEAGMEKNHFDIAIAPPEALVEFLRCGLALTGKSPDALNKLVLVDPDKMIRCIYNWQDQEQTDKLILELKILKQKI